MIAPLRRRHRWMWIVLTLVLVPLFAAAMSAKLEAPEAARAERLPGTGPVDDTPGPLIAFAVRPAAGFLATGPAAGKFYYEARLYRSADGFGLTLQPQHDLMLPDVLVYYAGGEVSSAGIPDRALLLGPLPLREHSFDLPSASRGGLYFYSLAHRRIIVSYDLSKLTMEVRDDAPTPKPEEL